MSELGPFYPTPGGKLQKNPHAWNQIANIIFLESPAFVGWSYSNTSTDIVVGERSLRLVLQCVSCWFLHSIGVSDMLAAARCPAHLEL